MAISDKYGKVTFERHGETILDLEPVAIITAHDQFALELMQRYRGICVQGGCNSEQLRSVDEQIANMTRWRVAHPELVRLPGEGS